MISAKEWDEKYGRRSIRSHHIIPDIEPYIAVSGDMQGKAITSRVKHRDFLRRNDFIEVGNEKSYMTRNGGMTDDNPNLISDKQHEANICQSLMKNLDRLKNP